MDEEFRVPPEAFTILTEVRDLVDSLDLTKEELEDSVIGIVAAMETYRPGYIQLFLATALDNRWKRQEREERENG